MRSCWLASMSAVAAWAATCKSASRAASSSYTATSGVHTWGEFDTHGTNQRTPDKPDSASSVSPIDVRPESMESIDRMLRLDKRRLSGARFSTDSPTSIVVSGRPELHVRVSGGRESAASPRLLAGLGLASTVAGRSPAATAEAMVRLLCAVCLLCHSYVGVVQMWNWRGVQPLC